MEFCLMIHITSFTGAICGISLYVLYSALELIQITRLAKFIYNYQFFIGKIFSVSPFSRLRESLYICRTEETESYNDPAIDPAIFEPCSQDLSSSRR